MLFPAEKKLRIGCFLLLLLALPALASASASAPKPPAFVYAPPLDEGEPLQASEPSSFSRAGGAVGPLRLVVIAVEFSDYGHTKSIDELEELIFGRMNEYVKESSLGKAWLEGEVAGWYRLDYTMAYYGRDGVKVDDVNNDGFPDTWRLIRDAIEMADADVNFNGYQYLMVIHAGDGQESSKVSRDIWSIAYLRGFSFKTDDDWTFYSAAIAPETEAKGAVPLGVYAHEFSHLLGLPDLYIIGSRRRPVESWGLMDKGTWNGQPPGSSPSHHCAWSKIELGWISESQVFTVRPGTKANVTLHAIEAPADGYLAVKIKLKGITYYLIEARAQVGFDSALPGSGILISLINENLGSGYGIVRVQDAHPETKGLEDAAFQVGETFIDEKNKFSVTVVSGNGSSYVVSIGSSSPAPDLAIQEISISPEPPRVNETVTISATVSNLGLKRAYGFYINCFIDGSLQKRFRISLDRGESQRLSIQWVAKPGKHLVEFEVDPGSSGVDMNWGNNRASKEFFVGYVLVIKVPGNLTVKVNGTSYSPNELGEVKLSLLNASVAIEVQEVVKLSEGEREVFLGWSDGEAANPRTVRVVKDYTLAARYKKQYKVEVDPGEGTAFGGGWYDEGAKATVEASSPCNVVKRKTRLVFVGWSGDVNSTLKKLVLTVDRPYRISAEWKRQYYLSVESPYGIASGSGWYDENSRAILSLSPTSIVENGTRLTFLGWSGDVNFQSANATILMDGPKAVEASWKVEHYLKLVSPYGDPEGQGWYEQGSVANYSIKRDTLELGNGTRRLFAGWSGDAASASPSGSILMDGPKTIKANWRTQYRLVLSASGVPEGTKLNLTVNSEVLNLTAPSKRALWLDSGLEVSLNASKKLPGPLGGYVFDHWEDGLGNRMAGSFVLDSPRNATAVYRRALGCLIATATYGSELAPEVQFLRRFRDERVMATFAGSTFMEAFNKFYYSFSPTVAEFVAARGWLRMLVKAALYPLLGVLHLSSLVYVSLSFNPELAVVASGVLASALMGLAYFAPASLAISLLSRRRLSRKILAALGICACLSLSLAVVAELLQARQLMEVSASLLVVSTLAFFASLPAALRVNRGSGESRCRGLEAPSPQKV